MRERGFILGIESVHYSSKNNEWTTPRDFYLSLCERFNFTVDLACTTKNQKATYGLCVDLYIDSLQVDWAGFNSTMGGWLWCNPPYGRELGKWVEKAYKESLKGAKIVMLIPARTDTSYWHDYIFDKAEIEFIRGRLKFGDAKHNAPFPSALVIYGK